MTVGCASRGPFALLFVVVLAGPAVASVNITGVISTGSHSITMDTTTITDESGGSYTFPTPGWQGDSAILDTFVFPPMDYPPTQIDLIYRVSSSPNQLSIVAPVPDSWYVIMSMPTEARVKFIWQTGIEESRQRPAVPMTLIVRPCITTGTTTLRAVNVGGGRCEVEVYDALGNRVRTVKLQRSGTAASATWNGTDEQGRQVPEGVYYCCLGGVVSPTVRKLVLTR